MTAVRALPVAVNAFPGETIDSYWRRLCAANEIDEKDLWLSLRRHDRTLPIAVTPRQSVAQVADLSGHRFRYGESDQACGHGVRSQRVRCRRCQLLPSVVSMCLRCSSGEKVSLARTTGPICIRHRRWHDNYLDIDVSGYPRHLTSQRALNGSLRLRGVSYQSSEGLVARDLLARYRSTGRGTACSAQASQLDDFPIVAEIMGALTCPSALDMLTQRRMSRLSRASEIEHIVATTLGGAASRGGGSTSDRDGGVRRETGRGQTSPASEFAMALAARMPTITARLLRHRNALLAG